MAQPKFRSRVGFSTGFGVGPTTATGAQCPKLANWSNRQMAGDNYVNDQRCRASPSAHICTRTSGNGRTTAGDRQQRGVLDTKLTQLCPSPAPSGAACPPTVFYSGGNDCRRISADRTLTHGAWAPAGRHSKALTRNSD